MTDENLEPAQNEEVAAPEAAEAPTETTEGEQKQEGEQTEQPKNDGSFVETENANIQARFGKLTSQRKTAEGERDALQLRLDQIEADKLTDTINRAAPREEDSDYDAEAHNLKLAAHYEAIGTAKGQQQMLVAQQNQRAVDQQAQIDNVYNEKVAAHIDKNPEFVQKMGNLQGMNVQLMNHIKTLPNNVEVFEALANDMTSANQINNAANQGDGITIGGILAQVQTTIANAPTDKKVTSAGGTIDSPIQGGITPENPDRALKHIGGATFE